MEAVDMGEQKDNFRDRKVDSITSSRCL